MTGLEIVLAVVIGMLVGVVVGLLGAGGSILTVPVLMLLLGLSATRATGTSLVVVGIVSSVGLLVHARAARVSWRAGWGFAATGVPAAAAGGYLAVLLSDVALTLILVTLLLTTSAWMWRRDDPEIESEGARTNWLRVLPTGLAVGLLTGTLGVGGGFLVVPALAGLLGLSMPVAVGTSQMVLAINAAAGLVGRAGTGAVAWTLGLVFAGGGALGVLVSGRLVRRVAADGLSRLFASLLVLVAVALLVQLAI